MDPKLYTPRDAAQVLDVKISGLMAQVTLSVGGQRITSIVTADAVRDAVEEGPNRRSANKIA